MLSDDQVTRLWENMLSAEARSLYFGNLGTRDTRYKQWITGCSFFFSSGAAATLIGRAPQWVPILLATLSAVITAYSIAVSLDKRVGTMAKLHSAWSQIAAEYQVLWSHTNEDDAEDQLTRIIEKERDPSELAITSAPNEQKLLREVGRPCFDDVPARAGPVSRKTFDKSWPPMPKPIPPPPKPPPKRPLPGRESSNPIPTQEER